VSLSYREMASGPAFGLSIQWKRPVPFPSELAKRATAWLETKPVKRCATRLRAGLSLTMMNGYPGMTTVLLIPGAKSTVLPEGDNWLANLVQPFIALVRTELNCEVLETASVPPLTAGRHIVEVGLTPVQEGAVDRRLAGALRVRRIEDLIRGHRAAQGLTFDVHLEPRRRGMRLPCSRCLARLRQARNDRRRQPDNHPRRIGTSSGPRGGRTGAYRFDRPGGWVHSTSRRQNPR
jgi:hypothetical protein